MHGDANKIVGHWRRNKGHVKMIASWGYFECELRECSKAEVTTEESDETLGVDSRTKVKRVRAKEESRIAGWDSNS